MPPKAGTRATTANADTTSDTTGTGGTLTTTTTSTVTVGISRSPAIPELYANTTSGTIEANVSIKAKEQARVKFSAGFAPGACTKTKADFVVEVDCSLRLAGPGRIDPASRRRVKYRFATYSNGILWTLLAPPDTEAPIEKVYDFTNDPKLQGFELNVETDGGVSLLVGNQDVDVMLALTVRAVKMPASSGSDFVE